MNWKKSLLLLIFALFSLSALQAATVTFTGGGDGTSWEDPANWDTGFVPTAVDDVIINGASSVAISTVVPANSLRIDMTASLVVNSTGVLSLNSMTNNGNMIQLNYEASLTNNGSVVVIQGNGNSIDVNDNARVTNNGFMNLIDPGGDPINLTGTSRFTNNGTIFGNDGSDAIELGDMAEFFNNGSIYLTDFSDEGIDLDASTTFANRGYLRVEDATNDLICIDGSGDHFINSGQVDLRDPGNTGIEIDDGLFTNEEGGIINISEGRDNGIQLESSGDFDNYGQINIQIDATSSADDGIDVQSNATFRNFNIVNINMTGNANANAIFLDVSSSTFRNEECGVVNMTSQHRIELDGGSNLINDGTLATVYSGTHDNQGNFTNNGQINAPNGFSISPNALLGTGSVNMNGAVPAQSDCNINFGTIGCGGEAEYNSAQDSYSLYSENCFYAQSYTSDEISYIFQELCGNGEIIARVASFNGEGWGGVMMREDLTAGSRKISLMLNQSQVARREARVSPNGPAFPQQFPAYGYSWVRLVRNGNYFMGFISQNGINWQFVMNQYIPMTNCIHIGLVATNYNQFNSSASVEFDNVFFSSAPLATPDVPGDLDIAYEAVTQESISVYPNPTSGKITIDVNSSRDELMEIRVINSLGQSVKRLSLNPTETFREEVDLSGLPSGMYYVHFQKVDGEMQVERVILNTNK